MIFRSLTVHNIGVFNGTHQFDLTPVHSSDDKHYPITIVRGHNGAGKSTLYQSLALALYGPLILGDRVSQHTYTDYLAQKLHRGLKDGQPVISDKAFVRVMIDYVRSGKPVRITIERRWALKEKEVKEDLFIWEDSQPVDVPAGQEQVWLQDHFSPGLLPICFFDAEQLDTLSSPETHNDLLREILYRLLGLDLVERLEQDLSYLILQSGASDAKIAGIKATIAAHDKSLKTLQKRREEVESDLRIQIERRTGMMEDLFIIEKQLAAEGGSYAARRPMLQNRLKEVEAQIQEHSETIRELCSGLLPFALSPGLSRQYIERLEKERDIQQWQLMKDLWAEQITHVAALLEQEDIWKEAKLSKAKRKELHDRVVELLKTPRAASGNGKRTRIIHRLTEEERETHKRWVREALEVLPKLIQPVGEIIRRLRSEEEEIRKELERAPEEASVAPLYERIKELQAEIKGGTEAISNIEKELGAILFQIAGVERDRAQAEEQFLAASQSIEQVQLAIRGQEALRRYQEELLRRRLISLEIEIVSAFNAICRKERLLRSAKIHPKNYHIVLTGKNGHIIEIDTLSAGERQIFAFALLHGLRRISKRAIPLLVDTPLARLDDVHRPRLLEQYFPDVSHQTILFTTNAEFDAETEELARSSTARLYDLHYDLETSESNVKEPFTRAVPGEGIAVLDASLFA